MRFHPHFVSSCHTNRTCQLSISSKHLLAVQLARPQTSSYTNNSVLIHLSVPLLDIRLLIVDNEYAWLVLGTPGHEAFFRMKSNDFWDTLILDKNLLLIKINNVQVDLKKLQWPTASISTTDPSSAGIISTNRFIHHLHFF